MVNLNYGWIKLAQTIVNINQSLSAGKTEQAVVKAKVEDSQLLLVGALEKKEA